MNAIRQFVDPLLQQLGKYLPSVFGALIILVLGWLLAEAVSRGVGKLLSLCKLDKRLQGEAKEPRHFELFLTRVVYYVMLLCVSLLVLNILGVEGVLKPVENMFNNLLAMFPNFVAAVLIGVIGFIVAKMVSAVVSALARSLDPLSKKIGLGESFSLSRLLGQVVFVFIFVPILVAALDAIQIEVISVPATEMLQTLMLAVPNILAAALILGVAFFVGRLVVSIISDLLKNLGADALPEKLGLGSAFAGTMTLSRLVGGVLLLFIMLGAAISAAEKLTMNQVADILRNLTVFAGQVALGLVILAVGNSLATVAYKTINASGDKPAVAVIARCAVLALTVAMGLRTMGIANDIIQLAFGLTLGAVAVAVALSFGIGGREAAGKQMEYWLAKMRK